MEVNISLKLAMLKAGVSNYALAKRLGCDPAKVSRILNGWLDPDEVTQRRIADELGVSVDELWGTKQAVGG